MADDSAQDRQLPASERRLQKAREDGQVPRSRDLQHFAALAVGGGAVVLAMPAASAWLQDMLAAALHFDRAALASPAVMSEQLGRFTTVFLWATLPLGLLSMGVAVAGALLAGGWVWTFQPLAPDFGKLNPLTGLPKLLSKHQLVDALKGAALALLIGAIGAWYLRREITGFGSLLTLPLPAALAQAGGLLQGGLALGLLLLALFALVDVPWQRHQHAERLKMTRQELKQEHKEQEGSNEVKSKVRALMRERVNRRMMAAVPGADLVVMNPTHFAVALKYDEATMTAPRVVAKGADLMAFRIRDLAAEHKVPVLQTPVLARALYAHAELEREIPAALFGAVAQVLAYVYQLRAALVGRAAMPADLPELAVPPELDPQRVPPGAPRAPNDPRNPPDTPKAD